MSTTMEKTTNTCESDRVCECDDEALFSELGGAKALLDATNAVKNCSESQEFNKLLCALENCLSENQINALNDIITDTLTTIKSVRANEKTREDLNKMLCIFTVALRNFISEEEKRELDIKAIRRVGRMIYESPEAFYNAVFGKRDE